MLQLSAEVLLHFFHVKPPGRKSGRGKKAKTLLVCPFVSVLKELNMPNIQSLAHGEGGAGPCPADCDKAAAEPRLSCMAAFSGCTMRPIIVGWPHMLQILGLCVRNLSHFSACSGGLEGGDGHMFV